MNLCNQLKEIVENQTIEKRELMPLDVFYDPDLSLQAKMVYACIVDAWNSNNGVCNKSVRSLALFAHVSKSRISEYIKELEDKEYIHIERNHRTALAILPKEPNDKREALKIVRNQIKAALPSVKEEGEKHWMRIGSEKGIEEVLSLKEDRRMKIPYPTAPKEDRAKNTAPKEDRALLSVPQRGQDSHFHNRIEGFLSWPPKRTEQEENEALRPQRGQDPQKLDNTGFSVWSFRDSEQSILTRKTPYKKDHSISPLYGNISSVEDLFLVMENSITCMKLYFSSLNSEKQPPGKQTPFEITNNIKPLSVAFPQLSLLEHLKSLSDLISNRDGVTVQPPHPKPKLVGPSNRVKSIDPEGKFREVVLEFYSEARQGGLIERVDDSLIDRSIVQLELLHRKDKFPIEKIREVLLWGLTDTFWCDKISSLANIRKKSSSNGKLKFVNLLDGMGKDKAGTTKNFQSQIGSKTKSKPYTYHRGGMGKG